ncbi:MAG: DUF3050 domain-containing protein [Sulfurimonadaceae bacterium]|nr:DUF3050 domain-containing protein [Sulfurimonadaceae bacterium]
MTTFPLDNVKKLRHELSIHPVYEAVTDMNDLTIFMQHHVYSVWDFMSLVKYLQNHIAPARTPWQPFGDAQVQRFINDIVLEEETDVGIPLEDGTPTYTSHFNLYADAMEEVKEGSSLNVREFVSKVASDSFEIAKERSQLPAAAKEFMETTFGFIKSDKPHVIAAAFALGREHIIPPMFHALLEKMSVSREEAGVFHYYLDRHIELDSDHHGPMSMRMLELLCDNDQSKIAEAEEAALYAIKSRIKFWDGVLKAIQNR